MDICTLLSFCILGVPKLPFFLFFLLKLITQPNPFNFKNTLRICFLKNMEGMHVTPQLYTCSCFLLATYSYQYKIKGYTRVLKKIVDSWKRDSHLVVL